MRNKDQEPLRSSTVGCPDDGVIVTALRMAAPGHWTVVNVGLASLAGGGELNNPPDVPLLRTTAPPLSNSIVAPFTTGGRIAIETVGVLPPLWK